ncbi:MAG: hypothetical protein KF678_05805 [Phycisphaeraceae bacterium]|nr:hypothetical protein [Phycisphaeraceae bacterium]
MKAVCLLILVAAMAGGCQSRPAAAGADGRQVASYRGRTLTCDLPSTIRVPSVAAAAEATLRHRGYSISRSPSTEDFARVEGQAPDAGWGECIVIRVRQTPSHTRVEIVAQPLGDQTLSRAVLAEMLAVMGL